MRYLFFVLFLTGCGVADCRETGCDVGKCVERNITQNRIANQPYELSEWVCE